MAKKTKSTGEVKWQSAIYDIPEMDELLPAQQMAVMEYFVDRSQVGAYYRAGYQPANYNSASVAACLMFNKPEVKAATNKINELLKDAVGVRIEEVLAKANMMWERAIQAVPVLDKLGQPTGEWKCNYKAALDALAMIAKLSGLVTDKVEVKGKIDHDHQHTHLHGVIQFTLEEIRSLPIDMRERLLTMMRDRKEGKAQAIEDKK